MDIGSQLRAAREAHSLTLEQVFKATRIKVSYLEAIEANQFQALPGPVQARGFVRSYANFLDLDGEHLASGLDAEKEPQPEVRPLPPNGNASKPIIAAPANKPIISAPPNKPPITSATKPPIAPADRAAPTASSTSRPALKLPAMAAKPDKTVKASSMGGIPNWVLIVGAVVLFVLGALLIITALNSTGQSPAPGESSNAPAEAAQTPIIDRTLTARAAAPTSTTVVSITLQTGEHVWVRVTLDGQTAFEGTLQPGTVQDWHAGDNVIVETGNAAAVNVQFRGQIAPLGQRGQIVARAWSQTGVTDVPLAKLEALPQATRVAATTIP